MRIAIFSDIHANEEALRAFIAHAADQAVDQYVCLGDVVGYGASPNQCIALLQTLPRIALILGNHDNAALGHSSPMNRRAYRAMAWTRKTLSTGSTSFLQRMKRIILWRDLLFSHTMPSPSTSPSWSYVIQKTEISKTFARTRAKIIFLGHTHSPSVITRKNFFCVYARRPWNRAVVPAALEKRQIFNCGSIGQPRDGDPRASYLIYDVTTAMVAFHRIRYDHGTAAQKIVDAGLPRTLANRLATGS